MYTNLKNNLLEWYANTGRHTLPWRNTNNIYHIYVSEIMLQQTQVSRVQEEYYPRFLDKYPTIQMLAAAPLDEVLATWSGLGYYSRARNLHLSAKECRDGLPKDYKELLLLKGIGRYTASAICSFGYQQIIPVVDTNIARVIRRFFTLTSKNEAIVWEKAELLLNHIEPKKHNLALMDLGSLICTPKNPKCQICPLFKGCLGKDNAEIYTKTIKKEYENLELFYGIWIKNNKIALVKSNGTMYKKMLELPTVEPIDENFIRSFKHSYTKYRLTVSLYLIDDYSLNDLIWLDLDKLDELPISSLTKKALSY